MKEEEEEEKTKEKNVETATISASHALATGEKTRQDDDDDDDDDGDNEEDDSVKNGENNDGEKVEGKGDGANDESSKKRKNRPYWKRRSDDRKKKRNMSSRLSEKKRRFMDWSLDDQDEKEDGDGDEDDEDEKDQEDDDREEQEEDKLDARRKKKEDRRANATRRISERHRKEVMNIGSYKNSEMQQLLGISPVAADAIPAANEKWPKRKVALFIAFVGSAYGGMQMNEGQRTIQAELEWALYRAGFLAESNVGFPHKYSWSNSARTDKGVHACAQVCSVKLLLPPDGDLDQVRQRINPLLPKDIVILDVVRTTRNFCAKTQRDCVRYQYTLPSFLLRQPKKDNNFNLGHVLETHGPSRQEHPGNALTLEQVQALLPHFVCYRATPSDIVALQQAVRKFQGTHYFHNYTTGKTPDDPSAQRYIQSFEVMDPFVDEASGVEWIPTQVVGQSFLLHQIRKMMAMAIEVTRGEATWDALDLSLTRHKMILPVAPAQGLFLDMSFFDGYHRRNPKNDALDWVTPRDGPRAAAMERWKEFKTRAVLARICRQEAQEGHFLKHLYNQEFHFDKSRFAVPENSAGLGQVKVDNDDKDDNDNDDDEKSGGPMDLDAKTASMATSDAATSKEDEKDASGN